MTGETVQFDQVNNVLREATFAAGIAKGTVEHGYLCPDLPAGQHFYRAA